MKHKSTARRTLTRFCLGIVALTCSLASQGRAQSSIASEEQVLQPGDSVRLVVWRQPELSGGFYVSSDGTLAHPLFSHVVVADVPIDTVRARIASTLAAYVQNPQFVMEPFFRVWVAGDVRAPGTYALPRKATIVQALAAAGGPLQDAQLDAVKLVRHGATYTINFSDLANPLVRSPVLSGDEIVVSQKNDILRNDIAPIAALVAAFAALTNVLIRVH